MKRKTPRGVWALRGITISIALIVLIVVGTVAYSAYEDVTYFRSQIAQGNHLVSGKATYFAANDSEAVTFEVNVTNRGLYPLNVTISCSSSNPDVHCHTGTAVVEAGQSGHIHFVLGLSSAQEFFASSNRQINGTVGMTLVPFASLSVGVNFTGFVQNPLTMPGGA